jgi:hypothetical protein
LNTKVLISRMVCSDSGFVYGSWYTSNRIDEGFIVINPRIVEA